MDDSQDIIGGLKSPESKIKFLSECSIPRSFVKDCAMSTFNLELHRIEISNERISKMGLGGSKATVLLLTFFVFVGCASPKAPLVLDPIGPAPHSGSAQVGQGALVVFSAFDPTPDWNHGPYRRRYTDYEIFSANGEHLIQAVPNNRETLLNSPPIVELASGAYHVRARANGYGQITVPVVIQAGQVTTVHLEGSVWWPRNSPIFASNPVRLPKGEIAGWRADAVASVP